MTTDQRPISRLPIVAVLIVGLAIVAAAITMNRNGNKTDLPERTGGVVVTINPIKMLIDPLIEGTPIEVTCLLDPLQSPHGYSASAADVAALRDARLLVVNGGGVDDWIADAARDEVKSGLTLVHGVANATTSDDLGAFETEDAHAGHDHDHDHDHDHGHDHGHAHTGPNPHLWLVPTDAHAYVNAMSEALQVAFPEYVTEIKQSHMVFAMDLIDLDQRYIDALEPVTDRRMITFHDAFTPLAEEYGLTVVASFFGLYVDQVPLAKVAEIESLIQESGVRAVFAEPQLSSQALDRFSETVNVRILDPLGHPDRDGYRTYLQMMQSNLDAIVEGLADNEGSNTAETNDAG